MRKNMSNEILLECKSMAIGYTYALNRKLDFVLNQKKILLIKGKNGSGKSTLIKTLLGKMGPITGSYKWKTGDETISYLPQITNPNSSFSYTINEILDLYSTKKELRRSLPQSLQSKKWINCSGGEKQKTMLVTRLTPETKVLILDEPFNHLDDKSVREITELLIELVSQKGLSIILVSHMSVPIPKELLKTVELTS